MSASLFDLGLRLAAHQQRRPVPRSAVRRFAAARDIHLLGVVAAPGDHGGLWGVSWAMPGGTPSPVAVSDPRTWASQARLWDELGRAWETWLTQCIEEERPAQFALADSGAVARVALSAARVASAEHATAHARMAARAFTIAFHQSRSAGQQSILPLVDALKEHYVTGADPVQEKHLGLWAQWPNLTRDWDQPQLALPEGMDGRREPLGRAWDRMEKHRDEQRGRDMESLHEGQLQAQIARVTKQRYTWLDKAYRLYATHPGPVMKATSIGLGRDGSTFHRLMLAERVPATRSLEAKWNTLHARERANERWQPELYAADDLERARGIASGDVLDGVAAQGRIRTRQDVLRVRPDDELTTGDGTTIRVIELLAEGDTLVVVTNHSHLSGPVTAWKKAGGGGRTPRPQIAWTHDRQVPTPQPSEPVTDDLLARVAALEARH